MAFGMSVAAISQNRVFNNYPDNKEISTVYISKAAMRLGLSMGGDDSDMRNIQKCIKIRKEWKLSAPPHRLPLHW